MNEYYMIYRQPFTNQSNTRLIVATTLEDALEAFIEETNVGTGRIIAINIVPRS